QWESQLVHEANKNKHLCTAEEMNNFFAAWPELLEESNRIAEKCTVTLSFDRQLLPAFPVPTNDSAHAYLTKLCAEKLPELFAGDKRLAEARLAHELAIIERLGFSDYFLIVQDFVQYAKENAILVGPGRGSAAGSLVSYVLGITNVNPLQYDLL